MKLQLDKVLVRLPAYGMYSAFGILNTLENLVRLLATYPKCNLFNYQAQRLELKQNGTMAKRTKRYHCNYYKCW